MLDGEKNLIHRAIKGEAEAFGLLYDHYLPKIYRYVYLKVSHREEAEDLTHQVFLKAWQNIEKYIPQELPISSWLYRIAKNQVIDSYRQRKPIIDIETVDPAVLADYHQINLDPKLQLEKITNALDNLTDEQRDVIIMRYVEDISVKDIAITMDKTEGAIRLLQHRAIERLKKIINSRVKDENEKSN